MTQLKDAAGFELSRDFDEGTGAGGLELGPVGAQYGELFANALQDGVITAEEREGLNRAADNLGMSREQLEQLELAMVNAYETHHRVKVALSHEAPPSLEPPSPTSAREAAPGLLLAQIDRLTRRVQELEEELREARSHVNVEVDLTGIAAAEAATDESPAELRARIRRDPTNPDLFARLYRAAADAGERDVQYRAAQALVVLGAAERAQLALVREYQPRGLIAPTRALAREDWDGALTHPELEVVTGHILGLVTPAALVGRVAALRREKKLPELSESQQQDSKKSTVMAVRALSWASTVLGMPTPSIYADVERDVAFAHVPGVPPYSLVGKGALSGRTQAENAFLAARHVTYYRPELFVRVLCPGVTDLEDLFLAALLVGSPSLPIASHVRARVAPISSALEPMLDAEGRDALREQFKAFVADGGRTNLVRWSDSVDKTACRAGLLLCGDLGCATGLLANEEGPEGPLRADLLGFMISERHTQLRRRLGISID